MPCISLYSLTMKVRLHFMNTSSTGICFCARRAGFLDLLVFGSANVPPPAHVFQYETLRVGGSIE